MSKAIFSAMMFALLCTGNLSPENITSSGHLKEFNSRTVAQYQVLSQNVSADLQDDFDDDDEEEQGTLA